MRAFGLADGPRFAHVSPVAQRFRRLAPIAPQLLRAPPAYRPACCHSPLLRPPSRTHWRQACAFGLADGRQKYRPTSRMLPRTAPRTKKCPRTAPSSANIIRLGLQNLLCLPSSRVGNVTTTPECLGGRGGWEQGGGEEPGGSAAGRSNFATAAFPGWGGQGAGAGRGRWEQGPGVAGSRAWPWVRLLWPER